MTAGKDDRSRDAGPTGWRSFYEWWTTLPGVLTAITGILVAAGGLLTAVQSLGGGSDKTMSSASAPTTMTDFSPPSRSEAVTIDTPVGNEVMDCLIFRGAAVLRDGRTLILGMRRIDPPDPEKKWYFQSDVKWTGMVGQSRWSSRRHFGTAPPQDYLVHVISIDRKTLKNVLATHVPAGTIWAWADTKRPAGTDIVKRLTVTQVPGRGDC